MASIDNDTAAFNRLMTSDYYLIRSDGIIETRGGRLRAFGSGQVRTTALYISDMLAASSGSV